MPIFEEYNPEYLYLTTTGWKSGKPHEIEIWYVTHNNRYYLMSESPNKSHWIQNIRHQSNVSFWVLGERFTGIARLVDDVSEPELVTLIKKLMEMKYQWGAGQVVELGTNKSNI